MIAFHSSPLTPLPCNYHSYHFKCNFTKQLRAIIVSFTSTRDHLLSSPTMATKKKKDVANMRQELELSLELSLKLSRRLSLKLSEPPGLFRMLLKLFYFRAIQSIISRTHTLTTLPLLGSCRSQKLVFSHI